jgi:hypothetical protein
LIVNPEIVAYASRCFDADKIIADFSYATFYDHAV